MNTILKIVSYRATSLAETALRVISTSNIKNRNMTLHELKNYLEIRMSEFPAAYESSQLEVLDDKLFVMEDGKTVSFIVERTKL